MVCERIYRKDHPMALGTYPCLCSGSRPSCWCCEHFTCVNCAEVNLLEELGEQY